MEHIEGRATWEIPANRKQTFVREGTKDTSFQILTFGWQQLLTKLLCNNRGKVLTSRRLWQLGMTAEKERTETGCFQTVLASQRWESIFLVNFCCSEKACSNKRYSYITVMASETSRVRQIKKGSFLHYVRVLWGEMYKSKELWLICSALTNWNIWITAWLLHT